MPAWLHHPVEKSHHSTWKYHQSSKYNERVFLIFHDPMHPMSSSSHMHFLKQYCQYEDPLKLVRSPCSRAQISVFVLGRCSPYPFKKVDCTYKASYAKVFSEFAKSARVSAPINPSEIKNPPSQSLLSSPSENLVHGWRGWVSNVITLRWGSEQTVVPNVVPRFLTPCKIKMLTSCSLVACEWQMFLLTAEGRFTRRKICGSVTEIPYWLHKICPESGQKC